MVTVNANTCSVKPEQVLTIVDFVDSVYMPWVRANKRASTINGYEKMWKKHLKGHFGNMLLSDYQPRQATAFLTKLAEKGMGLNAVKHVRSLMSGIFQHAAALGYTSTNPIHFAKVLVTPRAPKATPHYTIMEMASALTVLQGQTQARVAMALAFIGLRPSEIRGLKREDIDLDAGVLRVRRSAWRSSINEGGKGKNSVRDVTLGPTVLGILKEHMEAERSQRGFLLENSLGMPLDLDALARDVIRPTFAASGLEWKGYYGGRRGSGNRDEPLHQRQLADHVSPLWAHQGGCGCALHQADTRRDQDCSPGIGLDASGDYRETSGSGRIECKLMVCQ